MSVYRKLMQARVMLQSKQLNKSGHNKFAGYKYFELGDFLPTIQEIFNGIGLCGTISFSTQVADLTITDTDDGSFLTISSPMSTAALKGCHEVQNLGAVQTYLRRYLWVTAMEIVEHDALEAVTGAPDPDKVKFEKKVEKKPERIEGRKDSPWQIVIQETESDGWVEGAVKGADLVLGFAETPEDVLQIFKVNRNIFDKMKLEHKEVYDALMEKFKQYKTNLNKE